MAEVPATGVVGVLADDDSLCEACLINSTGERVFFEIDGLMMVIAFARIVERVFALIESMAWLEGCSRENKLNVLASASMVLYWK